MSVIQEKVKLYSIGDNKVLQHLAKLQKIIKGSYEPTHDHQMCGGCAYDPGAVLRYLFCE